MRHPLRIYIGFIVFFLVTAAAAGGLWLRQRDVVSDAGTVSQRIERGIALLREQVVPEHRFDLLDLYLRGGRLDLVDPGKALPHFHTLSTAAVRLLHDFAVSCDVTKISASEDPALSKAWLWARHACDASVELPGTFFETAPLMHPGGRSYVALALATHRDSYDEAWKRAHLPYAHVTELVALQGELDPDPIRRLLSSLSRPVLAALADNQGSIRAGNKLFLYARNRATEGGEYRVYPTSAWDSLNVPYELVERLPGTYCQAGDGIFCWISRPDSRGGVLAGVAILALAGLSLTLGALAVSRIRAQRRDREDQLFVLRTLTHELRTPATGLGLTLEALRDDFDRLPDSSQSAFLKLCDEVQRLSRVITSSTRYLRVHGPRDRFEMVGLDSLREFLEAVLEPYGSRIRVELPSSDRTFRTDPYWLKVCIANLVDNALVHGKPEVAVLCTTDAGGLTVRVSDQGSIQGTDLDVLARAASRREEGRGLGLGLGIVLRTVRDLGGTLTLTAEPNTTFTLRWRES